MAQGIANLDAQTFGAARAPTIIQPGFPNHPRRLCVARLCPLPGNDCRIVRDAAAGVHPVRTLRRYPAQRRVGANGGRVSAERDAILPLLSDRASEHAAGGARYFWTPATLE